MEKDPWGTKGEKPWAGAFRRGSWPDSNTHKACSRPCAQPLSAKRHRASNRSCLGWGVAELKGRMHVKCITIHQTSAALLTLYKKVLHLLCFNLHINSCRVDNTLNMFLKEFNCVLALPSLSMSLSSLKY